MTIKQTIIENDYKLRIRDLEATNKELIEALEGIFQTALRYAPIAEHGTGSKFEKARLLIDRARGQL